MCQMSLFSAFHLLWRYSHSSSWWSSSRPVTRISFTISFERFRGTRIGRWDDNPINTYRDQKCRVRELILQEWCHASTVAPSRRRKLNVDIFTSEYALVHTSTHILRSVPLGNAVSLKISISSEIISKGRPLSRTPVNRNATSKNNSSISDKRQTYSRHFLGVDDDEVLDNSYDKCRGKARRRCQDWRVHDSLLHCFRQRILTLKAKSRWLTRIFYSWRFGRTELIVSRVLWVPSRMDVATSRNGVVDSVHLVSDQW